MKEVKEFIYESLSELVKKFSDVKASILYKELSCAYYIKIESSRDTDKQDDLDLVKLDILDNFYDQNFNSTLVFIKNDNTLLELSDFDDSIIGNRFIDYTKLICFTGDLSKWNNEVPGITLEDILAYGEETYALAA
ncbi:hypothetical protein SRABI27_00316 [Pedobacter sp. Bi27]|uniref:hypothetical protein n=1 Tax=Pedobacter sp. Bi27 TaxID=2822351 RepID=UPI001DF6908C|nr:hypothetical protein [Pedobacter sp. Bi27]CAH0142555.1 hypothetical protein SRABI27_00316 [Pedobacter sp. Bi27]